MSIPNRQIGWSNEANLLWYISKELEQIICQAACCSTTTTSTLTPTTTTTTTLSPCATYQVATTASYSSVFKYIDCATGENIFLSISNEQVLTVCAIRDSVEFTFGIGTITEEGVCTGEADCSVGGYWFDEMTDEANSYLQSSTVDDNCNIYTVSTIGNSGTVYRKFDSAGTLIWETRDSLEILPFGCPRYGVSEIKVGPDGNLYVIYEHGVKKIDTDGNMIWESYWNNDGCSPTPIPEPPPIVIIFTQLYGVAFDKLGNMFISGYITDKLLILKVNTSTGVLTATKRITITEPVSSNGYISNAPLVDSGNNVIMYLAWYGGSITDPSGNYWQSTVFKFDNNLTELWNTRLDAGALPSDSDLTAFCIDGNDNIYCNGFGTSIYKLNSSGVLQWTRGIDSFNIPGRVPYLYNMSVSTEGDVFWIGDESCNWITDPEAPDPCLSNRLYVFKFDTNGNYQWATAINTTSFTNIYMASWNIANEGSVYKNKTLMMLAYVLGDPSTYYLIKHPLTQVTGTYGTLTFTDVTSFFGALILTPAVGPTLNTTEDVALLPGTSPFVPGVITSTITNTII